MEFKLLTDDDDDDKILYRSFISNCRDLRYYNVEFIIMI